MAVHYSERTTIAVKIINNEKTAKKNEKQKPKTIKVKKTLEGKVNQDHNSYSGKWSKEAIGTKNSFLENMCIKQAP